VCVLNRTSVYLHSFVYVIDHLSTAIFILAELIHKLHTSYQFAGKNTVKTENEG